MADPTVRASSTAQSGTTDTIVTKPTGTVDGDVLVVALGTNEASPTNPGGWTLLYGPTLVSAKYLSVWSKVASSEPSTWTWTSTSKGYIGQAAAIQDCTSATPSDKGAQNNASSANIVAPSITPTVTNTLLIGAFMVEANSAGITADGAMTEDQDTARGTNFRLELAHETRAAAGATGTRTAVSATGGVNTGWLGAFIGANSVVPQIGSPFFWSM